MTQGTGTYYDQLERWKALARLVGYGGGRSTLTVHRALADPRAQGRPTATRIHDVLIEFLPPLRVPRVLDAGCGLGGTLLDLASRIDGTFTGLTLSERQAQIGRRAIMRARLDKSIEILVRSYDVPPSRRFDVTVAIESLNRALHRWVRFEALRGMLDSYHGGLALERLYRRALMRYRLLIARKV